MPSIEWVSTLDNKQFIQSQKEIKESIERTAKEIEASGMSIDKYMDSIAKKAASVAAGFLSKELVSKIAQVRGEFQKLEVAFTTMLGSAEKADTLMQQLTKTAAVTPFDLQGVASGAKQLLAYGISAEKVNDTLVHLGDIAAGLSLPLGDLVYLYGTTMTQGRMFTQDLRQFMGRGIPIAEELAKQFGVTKDKVGELVTAGKVGAEEFSKAIMAMSSEGGKFAGLMEAQSKTINGQISNIEDAIDNMFNELGKKSEGVINTALGGVSVLVENYESIGKVIVTVAASYGAYKAALLAVAAAQKLATVWGEVQAFLSLAKSVTSAKDAMLLFNMVCKASPVGLVLGALTAAAVAFGLFSTSTSGAATAVEKYGKSAADTMRKVDTLTTELKGLTEGSALHKKVMEELNVILDQYGVAQIQEGDNIDMLNGKREKAIELIKQESIERQRLNSLEEGGNAYDEAVKNARRELLKDLKEAGTYDAVGFETWGEDEIRTNAEAISRIVANVAEENISLIAEKTGKEYENGLDQMLKLIQERMIRIGMSEDVVQQGWFTTGLEFTHDNIILKYLNSLKDAKEEYVRFSSAINAIAEADAVAIEKPADKARETADFSQTSTEKLIKKIAELKEACDGIDREIDIRIKWGASISFNSDDVLDFTDLQNAEEELKKRMRQANNDEAVDALLKELRTGKGKAEYGSSERRLYEKAITELEKRKSANSGKNSTPRKDHTAEREAQQRQRLFELEQRQLEEQARQARDMMDAMTDARIAQIQDGGEREREERKAQFERTIRQIHEQAEQYKKASYQEAKERFDAANKNKGVVFSDTEEGKRGWQGQSLTDDQQSVINARLQEARAEHARQLDEGHRQQKQHLYDYIKEYGSIQMQREAITKEYDEKIARESDAVQRAALQKQKEQQIQALNFKELQGELNWEEVFGDLSRLSVSALRTMRERLRQALDAKDITAENAQVITGKIREIEDTITDKSDVWSSVLPGLRERKRLSQQSAEAENEYGDALRRSAEAAGRVIEQKQRIKDMLEKTGATDGLGQIIEIDMSAISIDMQNTIQKMFHIEENSELSRQLSEAFRNLKTATIDLEAAEEKKNASQRRSEALGNLAKGGDFKTFAKDLFNTEGMGFTEITRLAAQNANSLADFVDKIGLENTDFGQAVHGFSEGVGGFNSTIQSLQNGDVIGAVNGVLDGIAGFAKFGTSIVSGRGNEEDMEKQIAELSKSNDRLSKSIDSLTERIGDSNATNEQSIDAYQQVYEAEKEWQANQRKAIEARASEWASSGYGFLGMGGKHSFNTNMAGGEWKGWRLFSDILSRHTGEAGVTHGSVNGSTLWSLTPEEMRLLRDFAPKEWEALFNTDGHRSPEDLVNEYMEHSGALDALTSALNEKLTGYTWDGFMNSYKSMLKNLTSTTEDFSENIEELISNALVESFANSEETQKRIRELYSKIAQYASKESAGGTTLTKDEINDIRETNEAIAKTMLEWREAAQQAGLIKAVEETGDAALMTIDTIKDRWMDMLMDMSADTEDWGSDIAKIMTQTLINSNIFNDEWESVQEEWLDRYNKALHDQTLTDVQRKALLKGLQEEQEQWVEDSRRKAKAIMEMTGYDTLSPSEQSASVQAMGRITVDQADELIGRMNAGQLIWEQQRELQSQISATLSSLNDAVGINTRNVGELVSLALTRNQTISAINEYCKAMYQGFSEQIDDIRRVLDSKL